MNKLYSTLMMLAMMFAALCFTACSSDSDEDEGSVSYSSLVGTWQTVYTEGWGVSVGVEDGLEYIQFKQDGSFIRVLDDEDGIDIENGLWKIQDGDLVLRITDGEIAGSSFAYKILDWGKEKITVSVLGFTAYLQKVPDSVMKKYLKR